MEQIIIIDVDMDCEVIYTEKGLDLRFESGEQWNDDDFEKCGVVLHNAYQTSGSAVQLKGTEEQLRSLLGFYGWDDIDFIIEECQVK